MTSHKTAISRKKISAPMRWLFTNHPFSFLGKQCLDYGCGKGFDADQLNMYKYDPYYFPGRLVSDDGKPLKFDTITCNYVLNVIEDQAERESVVAHLLSLLNEGGTAYITVRNDRENLRGYTTKGTWQGFIELDLPIIKRTRNYIIYELKK